jgi:5,5'-dehydrodivanillate O-demethylase
VLNIEQNERITQVGPGTPMGNLLRRYWMPVAASSELKENPTKAVRIMGEDLVLYKDRSGTLGLIQESCPHRRVNLLYGIPEQRGLRCPYHGWVFDETGQCLEMPAEAPDSTFKDRVKADSYPVEELGGMIWAYLGPEPRPMVPRWSMLVEENVMRDIGWAILPCNWLQIMENSLDPVHVEHLHQYFSNYVVERLGKDEQEDSFWRNKANVRHHVKIGFDIFEYGIIKRRILEGDNEKNPLWRIGHPIIFPNMLRLDQIRVPIDDTHTMYWWYNIHAMAPGEQAPEQLPADIPLYEVPLPGVTVHGLPTWEILDNNSGQDNMAWMSQGPISQRWVERLGESDKGIILYRRLLREQVNIVEDGGEPMNTFRDPANNVYLTIPSEHQEGKTYRERGDGAIPRREGGINTGRSGKYSPIAQQRATQAGVAVPGAVVKAENFGQVHPSP